MRRIKRANTLSFRNVLTKKVPTIFIVSFCWLILIITFSSLSRYFLRFNNIMNLIQYCSVSGVAACGYMLVVVSGCLDLSAATLSALASVYAARVVGITDNWLLGVLAGVAVGFLGGCVNGFLITKLKINPLITTLGTSSIFQGIASLENNAIGIAIYNEQFKTLGQGYVFGGKIPVIVLIMFAFFALFFVILKYTKFGRAVYSVGGNANASYVSGINVSLVRFGIFLTCSTCAGVAGVLYAALTGSGIPSANATLTMDSISAIVLGGAKLSGGAGSITGTLIGVLTIATITNGLTIVGVSTFYQMIAKGAILLIAVLIDVLKGEGRYE